MTAADRNEIPSEEYPVDANSAFEYIHATGNYYFCPDIPERVKKQEYKNPRLIISNALEYKKPSFRRLRERFFSGPDREWMKCWSTPVVRSSRLTLPPEACYKSTLVVPMTLYNNQLSAEFRDLFRVKDISPQSIYGFFCLDNHMRYYFNDNEDVCMGYIFADLLSQYLITKLIYTENSETFSKAKQTTRAA